MKVLVINCSPKRENSDCLRITRAFLDGMGVSAETVHAVDLNIKPCLGCYACWHNSPGKCVQNDDIADMLSRITSSDLVIWSTPLYCYGFPACGKAIIDRMLPLSCPAQEVDENGRTYHPNRKKNSTRFMLISGCGFPNIEHNYEALLTQFGMLFGENYPRILCVEAPLVSIPEARPVVTPYMGLVRKAGEAFAQTGSIPAELQAALDSPMFPPEQYRSNVSGKN